MTVYTTTKLAANNLTGVVQGNFGTYTVASDGILTVDTRDVPALLVAGATYISAAVDQYVTYPNAPAAASATAYVASTTLTNGSSATISAQPDVMRQGQLVVTALRSPGPSAGSVSVVYTANDGSTTTDVFAVAAAGVTPLTYQTSKGMVHISSVVPSGIAAGTSFITFGSTAVLSVPVNPGGSDIVFIKENIDSGDEAVGTKSTVTLGSISPTTAPNATHTYGFIYTSNQATS